MVHVLFSETKREISLYWITTSDGDIHNNEHTDVYVSTNELYGKVTEMRLFV